MPITATGSLGVPCRQRAEAFIHSLLHEDADQGGKNVWAGFAAGLITEVEVRDVVMANMATWLAHENDAREPAGDRWVTADIELEFERALLGRPARRR